jgi:hypothetical protein
MIRKKRLTEVPTDLTEIERDLLWHMQNGYQLETDSLGGHLLLRRMKDKEVIRLHLRTETRYRGCNSVG